MLVRFRTTLLLLGLVTLAVAIPSSALGQAPGYPPVDNGSIMAAFYAEVLENVNRVMDRWGAAWSKDDVERVADLYWDNAVLIPPGTTPLRGQDAIVGYLTRTLPEVGSVEAFMLDFDASGGMAVVHGNYTLEAQGGVRQSGPLVTVYLQRGRTWKIRSQVFMAP